MSLYRPFSAAIEKIRLLFKRRVRDGQLAYLGDGHGRVEIQDKPGYVYARFPGGQDASNNVEFSTPFPVRASGVAFPNFEGTPVYVAVGYNNELEIVSANYQALDRAGIDTRILNPLHQQSRWVYLWQLTIGLASAVSNSVNSSFLVTIKKFRHYTGNVFATFETATEAEKIDLEPYIPAVDQHRYAGVWVDTYTNAYKVTVSTAQSLFTPLDSTDIQECVSGRPADGTPHKLFYLANDAGSVTVQPASDVDVRQFMNMPTVWGFPNPVLYPERVRPNYQLITATTTIEPGGVVTVEPGGIWVIIPASGGGGTASSIVPGTGLFNITADSGGTTQVKAAETIDFDGADGIDTTLAGLMLSFAVDNTVIRTTGTQAIAAGLTVTSPKINEILDSNGNEVTKFVTTASANAEVSIANGVNIATISVTGDNANLALEIRPKGSGGLLVYAPIVPGADDTYNIGTTTFSHANIFAHLATLAERTAPSTPSSGFGSVYVKVSPTGQLFFVNDSGVHKQATESIAILSDEKSTTTDGGSSSAATWNARDLNTENSDLDGIVTISSNKFVPVAGDYICQAWSVFKGGTAASVLGRNRLFNVTGAASVEEGLSLQALINTTSVAEVTCKFTANGTDEYRIDTYTSVARATNGLGTAVSDGSAERYTVVVLTKVA